MYVLYYLNKNYAIQTIEVEHLNAPILLIEACIFTNIRKGINFIKEPNECLKLTDLERLIMSTEFFDMSTIKEADFRKENTYLENGCQIDLDFPWINPNINISTFDFGVNSVRDEGDERISFNGGFDLTKVRMFFTNGIDQIYTEPLSYYLQSRPEFGDMPALNPYNNGESYSFSIWRVPTLQDGSGETKSFRWCYFVGVNDTIEFGSETTSISYSLANLLKGCVVSSWNADTKTISLVWHSELYNSGTPFVFQCRNGDGSDKFESSLTPYNDIVVSDEMVSGDIIMVHDPSGYWGSSNYFVIP